MRPANHRRRLIVLAWALAACADSASDPPTLFAPYNVVTTAVPPDRINIAWTDANSAETGYLVEYSVDGGAFQRLTMTRPDATTATHDGVQPGVTYRYRISACRESVCASGVETADTRFYLPPLASNSQVTTVTATSATLTGEVVPLGDDTRVFFEYDTRQMLVSDSAMKTEVQSVSPGTAAVMVTLTITGLAPNTEYQFRIVAANAGGVAHGPTRSFRTLYLAPSRPPSNVMAYPTSSTSIGLTWLSLSGSVTSYRVEMARNAQPFVPLTEIAAVNWDSVYGHFVAHENVDPTADYHYRVRACNPGGCSPASAVATATTRDYPRPDWLDYKVTPDSTSAHFVVTLNPNGWPSTAYIEVTDRSTGKQSFGPRRDIGGARTPVVFTETISGLLPGHEHYWRIVVDSPSGRSSFGGQPFRTLESPASQR